MCSLYVKFVLFTSKKCALCASICRQAGQRAKILRNYLLFLAEIFCFARNCSRRDAEFAEEIPLLKISRANKIFFVFSAFSKPISADRQGMSNYELQVSSTNYEHTNHESRKCGKHTNYEQSNKIILIKSPETQ